MVGYNLSGLSQNTTGILTFIQGVNHNLLFDTGGIMILISMSVILFGAFYYSTGDMNKALIGTSFIAFVLSLSMKALDLVPNLAIFLSFIICAIIIAVTNKD